MPIRPLHRPIAFDRYPPRGQGPVATLADHALRRASISPDRDNESEYWPTFGRVQGERRHRAAASEHFIPGEPPYGCQALLATILRRRVVGRRGTPRAMAPRRRAGCAGDDPALCAPDQGPPSDERWTHVPRNTSSDALGKAVRGALLIPNPPFDGATTPPVPQGKVRLTRG
jgi:hypothetical protein